MSLVDFTRLSSARRTYVFAHRGASQEFRENTLDAFAAAIDAGVDGVELDVRRTRDGILLVHHNARVLRSSRWIKNLDYDDVLRLARRRAYHVPTLDEALRLCAGRIALDIELKEGEYEDEVVKLTRSYCDLRHVAFTSFRSRVVAAVREAAPKSTTGWIIGVMPPGTLQGRLQRGTLVSRIAGLGASLIVPHRRLVTSTFAEKMIEAGLPVAAWTVNNATVAKRLVRRGVAIIVSDVPERIIPAVRDVT